MPVPFDYPGQDWMSQLGSVQQAQVKQSRGKYSFDPGLSGAENNIHQHYYNNRSSPGAGFGAYVVPSEAGKFTMIPSDWGGKELTREEARKKAGEAGWDKWPTYNNIDQAKSRIDDIDYFVSRGSDPSGKDVGRK